MAYNFEDVHFFQYKVIRNIVNPETYERMP